MRRLSCIAIVVLALAACGRNEPVASNASAAVGTPQQSASASTTVGGVTLQTSTVAIADLNDTIAARYGIDRTQDGLLLLVTVRDDAGNGIGPGDLQLKAAAGALPDAPTALELRSIQTDGMTDYIGVFRASPPATVQFKITAIRGGSRADIATTAELHPR